MIENLSIPAAAFQYHGHIVQGFGADSASVKTQPTQFESTESEEALPYPTVSAATREVFSETVTLWQELRLRKNRLLRPIDCYTPRDMRAAGALVAASISDFVCDVEIAARRRLTFNQLTYFCEHYGQGFTVDEVNPDFAHVDAAIQNTLAREFRRCHLFPLFNYVIGHDVLGHIQVAEL